MKKNILFFALIAVFSCNTIIAKSFTPAFVKGSTANYLRLGICNHEFNENEGLGIGNSSAEVHAVTKLSADFVAPYEGAIITGINFGLCEPLSNITVFIRETATGAYIASKKLANAKKGWNSVIFDTPLTLEKKNYYIGYHIPTLPPGSNALGYNHKSAATAEARETLMLSIDKGAFDDFTDYGLVLSIQLLLTGDEAKFGNKAEVVEIGRTKPQPINSVLDIPVKFRNIGTNKITNIEITYKLGTNTPATQSFSIEAPAGSVPQTVTLEDVQINMSGNFTVSITKVNGIEFSGTPVSIQINTYDPTKNAERKVLLEQFSTEKCGSCPSGTSTLKKVVEQPEFADNVLWVVHHAGYYPDSYTIPESVSYERFYGNADYVYAPAMMLDRTIFDEYENVPVMGIDGDEEIVADFFREALNVPTTTSIVITQSNTVDVDRKVRIEVYGKDLSGTPPTEDLYVYIFLLENGIKTTTQSNSGGSYTHNNLIRSAVNGAGGAKITWNGNTFSVTAEATLPTEWKAENMDVVAFVAKNYQNPLNNTQVLNAEKVKLIINSLTAVENVYSETIHAYAKNGTIVVNGEYTSISIYGIDGKEFRNNNLPKGIYIVKVENKSQSAVKKVMLR